MKRLVVTPEIQEDLLLRVQPGIVQAHSLLGLCQNPHGPGNGSDGSRSGACAEALMTKEEEILAFLHHEVFGPILTSAKASESLKKGVRYTIMRLKERDAAGMISYYWSAIVGTDRSVPFASSMRQEGFTRFEETIDEFRRRFDDRWLRGVQAKKTERFAVVPINKGKVRATVVTHPADTRAAREQVAALLGLNADDVRASNGPGAAVFDVTPLASKEPEFATAVSRVWPGTS